MKNHMVCRLEKMLKSFTKKSGCNYEDLKTALTSLIEHTPNVAGMQKNSKDSLKMLIFLYKDNECSGSLSEEKYLELLFFVLSISCKIKEINIFSYKALQGKYSKKQNIPISKIAYIAVRAESQKVRFLAIAFLRDRVIFEEITKEYAKRKIAFVKKSLGSPWRVVRKTFYKLIERRHPSLNYIKESFFKLKLECKYNERSYEILLFILSLKAEDERVCVYALNNLYAIFSVRNSLASFGWSGKTPSLKK